MYSKRGLLGVNQWVDDVAMRIATVAGLLDLCTQTVCRACGFLWQAPTACVTGHLRAAVGSHR